MDANSALPSADIDAEKSANSEYDTLLDLNEKHEHPADSKEQVPDIEAGHPKPEADDAPAPKPPRAPLSREKALGLRINAMDNIRTLALSLILLQNAAIQAVSTHRDAVEIHETWPKSFVLITLFVGMTRLLAVPLLFFVAGFSSHFTMVVHGRSPIRFVLRRTWKTALTVVFYQAFAYLAKLARPLPPAETPTSTPYYASRAGIQALLNGPTFYVLAVLVLDSTYALLRTANTLLSRRTPPTHWLTTKTRYELAKLLFVAVEVWVILGGHGATLAALPPARAAWLYATSSAELHFPLLYLIAYAAGVHFVHYHPALTALTQRKGGFAPTTVLLIRLTLSVALLYTLYTIFPAGMAPFLDVRARPALVFAQKDAVAFYGMWVVYVLLVVPEAVVGVFFTCRALATDWGAVSRTAPFQVYVQMLYVVGNQMRFFDNVFWRWVLLGWAGVYYAYYGGRGAMGVGNLVMRGWVALRTRFGRKVEQPVSI